MVFAPVSTGAAVVCMFLSFAFWGAHPILRRIAPDVDGAAYSLLMFAGEGLWAIFLCTVLGELKAGGSASTFLNSTSGWTEFTVALSNTKSIWILAGGAFVGAGDFVLPIVMSYIPASIAFPTVAGVCLMFGTVINVAIDGSEKPVFLYTGLFFALAGVVCLAYGQSKNVDATEAPDSGSMVTVEMVIVGEKHGQKVGVVTSPLDAEKESTRGKTMQWILLLIIMGINNSAWGPLSTVGRSGSDGITDAYPAFMLLELGRVGIQVLTHLIYNGCSCYKKLGRRGTFAMARAAKRRDVGIAFLNGAFVSMGYFCYFLSSSIVNKAAAFAVSNCSPLFTVFLGVCLLRELKNYTAEEKKIVAIAIVLYATAISFLTMAAV